MAAPRYDVCVVGAGLVGLATARAIADSHSGISILVLEKEPGVAAHQSSHNSGVIHSGLYYRPGSLKARLAVEGRRALYELAEVAGIAHGRSGKVVIASDRSQLSALEELERRGKANGLSGLRRLEAGEIRDFEPAATGVAALLVPEAGVIDFGAVASHLTAELARDGTQILTGSPVTRIEHNTAGVRVATAEDSHEARVLVNCAGLHADHIAELAGVVPRVRIVPFRGEYYQLSPDAAPYVRALIYPVPDPRFPFLGVHFTRRVDGVVEVGPNAVVALGREHYRGASPNWAEVWETLTYRGFLRFALNNWRSGIAEILRSRSRRLYAKSAAVLVPAVERRHLMKGGAGVRAQAVRPDGTLEDDFVFEEAGSTVHVLNAPSPAATASLAIGVHIAERVSSIIAVK